MNMWKRIVWGVLGIILGCLPVSGHLNSGKTLVEQVSSLQQTSNEDFYAFEKKFVSDAKFQMSRIIFDDLGYLPDDDPESEGTKYSPENWSLSKNTFEDVRKMGQYKTDMKLTSNKCVQTIWIEDSSFFLKYTYTKIKGKWYLTKVIESY